ncbi:MAG: tetratricopeptide repeat protein [Candidatus Hydrothermae bacterium]|nr:tetratricopeptide repeat protein [Candidatus Hydrothermae bacterium]
MLAKDDLKLKQKEALRLLSRGRYDDALRLYEEIVEVSHDPDIYNTIGDIYIRKQDIQKAIDYYTMAFRRYKEGEYYENAIALAKKILRYDKSRKDLKLELADLYLETGDLDLALENLSQLVDEGLPPSFLDRAFELMNRMAERIQEDEEHLARFERLFIKLQEMAEAFGELTLESGEFHEFYEDDVSKMAEFLDTESVKKAPGEMLSEVEEAPTQEPVEEISSVEKQIEEKESEIPEEVGIEEKMEFLEVETGKKVEEEKQEEVFLGEETKVEFEEEEELKEKEEVPIPSAVEEAKESVAERAVPEVEVPKEVLVQIVEEIKDELVKDGDFPYEEEKPLELGIEYLEMGFKEAAIKELQRALDDPRTRLKAMEYLGRALLEMGEFDFAEKILRKGIEEGGYDEKEYLGIFYYLAQALEFKGMEKEALEYYENIYLLDAGFKNVKEKIRKLRRVL